MPLLLLAGLHLGLHLGLNLSLHPRRHRDERLRM
jgi:hypothetical protein